MKIETKFNVGDVVYAIIHPDFANFDCEYSIEEMTINKIGVDMGGGPEIIYKQIDEYDPYECVSADEEDCFPNRRMAEIAMSMYENKNSKQSSAFALYCKNHPDERFWQALSNWSGKRIYSSKDGCAVFDTYED